MLFKSALSASFLASAAMGHALKRSPQRTCGAPEPSAEHQAIAAKFNAQEASARANGRVQTLAAINVPVYFHIVSASQSGANAITDDVVSQQMDVMNEDYAPAGVSFTLQDTTRSVNSAWANDQAELDMKSSLRQGDYSTLNLYFMDNLGEGALGYCYFPTDAPEGSQDFTIDGCSILAASVPGGSADGFNLGKTAVHETGHWLGLYHTFQGGCSGSGDSVDDTPAEASPASGCPVGRDTCPAAGEDPIHNYMDYTTDECYEEFTAGQIARISSFWTEYRG